MPVISDKKLQDKIKWSPHSGQQEVLDSKARDKVISAGVRWGKSALCGYEVLKHLLSDNQRIWIVSLNYDLAKKVFDYVTEFAGRWDRRLLRGVSNRIPQYFRIPEFNSWVECKSAENPSSLMGEELNLAIIDEAARMRPEIWERYLMARLASRQGKSFTISTPFGKNWFYRRWLEEKENGGAFHFTSKDNPHFPQEEWDRASLKLPEQVFKQEYEARFLDDAASVFRGIREIATASLSDARPGHFYCMGVDIGRVEDFSVITVIDQTTNSVVYWDRFNKIDYPFQKKRILAVSQRYNNARITLDSTSIGTPIKQDLEYAGAFVDDMQFSLKSKKLLIEKLSVYIEQKYIRIPAIEVLLDELESFGYNLSSMGNIIYSAPQGLHDDCVWSLALACWNLEQNVLPPEKITSSFFEEFKKPLPNLTRFHYE
jgi:hypothetical protein